MMQDYMVTRKDVRRVESGSHEKVIKDFRQRMTVRKEQADAGRHMSGILGTACGVLTVAVLAGGVAVSYTHLASGLISMAVPELWLLPSPLLLQLYPPTLSIGNCSGPL